MTTSLFVVPHPDDDVIRHTATMITNANRGDRMILLSVTSGGAANNARLKGWSVPFEQNYRQAEQDAAFSHLTYGRGEVIRLRMMDQFARADVVRDAILGVIANCAARSDPLEVYVSAHWVPSGADAHNDHIAAAQGALQANPSYLRFGEHPTTFTASGVVVPVPAGEGYMDMAESSHRVYNGLERQNPAGSATWTACINNNYASSLVEYDGPVVPYTIPFTVEGA